MATDPRNNPGFRQFNPGTFTDDELFAQGKGYAPHPDFATTGGYDVVGLPGMPTQHTGADPSIPGPGFGPSAPSPTVADPSGKDTPYPTRTRYDDPSPPRLAGPNERTPPIDQPGPGYPGYGPDLGPVESMPPSDQPRPGYPGYGPAPPPGGGAPPPAPGPPPGPGGRTPPIADLPSPTALPLAVPSGPQAADVSATMRQILIDQMKGAARPTDENSPEIAPAIAAYKTQSERDQQGERDMIAERAYATDGGTALHGGGFNTEIQGAAERSALGRANFAGSQVARVATEKRAQLVQMLQTASQYGLTDQAQKIQAQIAMIDAQLRQQGITNQMLQFGTTAQLTAQQMANQLGEFGMANNADLQRIGLDRQRLDEIKRQFGVTSDQEALRIFNQNNQANNNLGFNYADLQARMNRDAILAGLQG